MSRSCPHSLAPESIALSPDGARLLTGSPDNTVKLWDLATGALLRTFEGQTGPVAFSSDGTRVLSGGSREGIRLWDAATGALVGTFEKSGGCAVGCVLARRHPSAGDHWIHIRSVGRVHWCAAAHHQAFRFP